MADFVISSHMKNNQLTKPNVAEAESEPQESIEPLNEVTADPISLDTELNSMSLESTKSSNHDIIPQDILRKYIIYARMYVKPTVGSIDSGKIQTFYAQLRRASQHTGAVPIAVRHIESLFRMAEAYARMHLRDTVRDDDIDMAIRVMTESLCTAQKFTYQKQWKKQFRHYLEYGKDNNSVLMFLLQEMFKTVHRYETLRTSRSSLDILKVSCSDFAAKAKSYGIFDFSNFYQSHIFKSHAFRLDDEKKYILKRLTN